MANYTLDESEVSELIRALEADFCEGDLKWVYDHVKPYRWHVNDVIVKEGKFEDGMTLLHLASEYEYVRTAKWLLEHKADITLEDKYGLTAWDVVMERCLDLVADRSLHHRLTGALRLMDVFLEQIELRAQFQSEPLIKISDCGEEFSWLRPIKRSADHWAQWYRLEDLSILHVLILARCVESDESRRLEILRRILEHFDEQEIPDLSLSFRKPCFEGHRIQSPNPSWRQSYANNSIWCFSMPYITGTRATTVTSRGELRTYFRKQTGADLHLPSTLDEYCKPVLGQILKGRNNDQVITKYKAWTSRVEAMTSSSKTALECNDSGTQDDERVITVNQAWIWVCGASTIIAMDSPEAGSHAIPEFEQDEVFTMASREETHRALVGSFVSEIIDRQDHPKRAGLPEHFLDVYENAIHLLSSRVHDYSRFSQRSMGGSKQGSKYFTAGDLSVEIEAEFYHDAADIREELSMIRLVLSHQEEVWKKFMRSMFADHWKGEQFVSPVVMMWQSTEKKETAETDKSDAANELRDLSPSRIARLPEDKRKKEMERRSKRMEEERKNMDLEDIWRRIARPQNQFQAWNRRISRLDEDATRIEASIKDVVELRARHISLKESHATALMSAAVFGFTLITIIFTPLSFALSLFALPIKELQDHKVLPPNSTNSTDSEDPYYTTNYIGKYLATTELVSIAVTVVAMVAAVEFGLRGHVKKRIVNWLNKGRTIPEDVTWYDKKNGRAEASYTKSKQWIPSSVYESIYQLSKTLFGKNSKSAEVEADGKREEDLEYTKTEPKSGDGGANAGDPRTRVKGGSWNWPASLVERVFLQRKARVDERIGATAVAGLTEPSQAQASPPSPQNAATTNGLSVAGSSESVYDPAVNEAIVGLP